MSATPEDMVEHCDLCGDQLDAGQIGKCDGCRVVRTWLPFRSDVTEITAHRPPTPGEIRFGHGATHYRTFPRELWEHPNGRPKAWIKADDGLRYYRR